MLMQRIRQVAPGFALAVLAASVVWASAPPVKTQAPGYYRWMLGGFEVTVLLDGTSGFTTAKMLTNVTPAVLTHALKSAFLKDPIETSVDGFLINTGTKLVLIDTGCGALCGPTTGNLVANLKAAGYQPEQVDEVYITHMHGDHVGGLVSGGKLVFPNAIVRADRREADYWLNAAHRAAAPKDQQESFDDAMNSVNPYVTAGKFKPFDGDTELVPGIRAVASHGHTPGHSTYMVESDGQKLALWGDLVHVGAVQFPHPSVTISFDVDAKAAVLAREKAYADAADGGYWVAAAHLSFPGTGHLRRASSGYTFIPANYTSLR